jgi:hypothetical protein
MGDRAHEMAMLQTQMTRAEAIEWAEKRFARAGHWPTRRYRVQDSRAGTSKLLSKTEAHGTMTRYGGKIVELVPSRVDYLAEFKGVRLDPYPMLTSARDLPECPTCKAPTGTPCKRGDGEPMWPHVRRIKAVGYATAEAMMLAQAVLYDGCAACDAGAGIACTRIDRIAKGRKLWWPHRMRRFRDDQQLAAAVAVQA